MRALDRLKNMTLKGKIIVPMMALSILPAAGIALFTIVNMQTSMRTAAIEREVVDTSMRTRELEEFLNAVETDLRFLSKGRLLNDLAEARSAGQQEQVDLLRRQVEQELILFSQGKRSFYQVRYIDTNGLEVVRLDVEEGQAKVVPVAQLQNKSDRYYVQESLKLSPGQLYKSPMDLNMEGGRVEIPFRPVLRFGIPLFGESGERTGSLILNLGAKQIFELIQPLRVGTEAFFVDATGTYLGYVGPTEEKYESYSLGSERGLSDDFSAAEVSKVLGEDPQALHFETPDAVISVEPVVVSADSAVNQWRLIVSHPLDEFGAPVRNLTIYLSVIIALVLALVVWIGVLVSNNLARPVAELRKAMSRIATDRGAVMRVASPGPVNELDALSREFQLMAERLEQTQSRLQGLQTGLDDAEKSSSMGQLTSGLLQELRDPLSAIRNKVQAISELDEDTASRTLAHNLLADVHRMEEVLQLFSAETQTPQPEVSSLAAIVKSVVALVGAELRHRGLQLEVDADPGVPSVKGDFNQLRQLLINLILNAADAKPESNNIIIKISAVMSDDPTEQVPVGAMVKVIDDGKGISTESLIKIWEPFYTTKQDGVGLGLAICRRIVEEHGGRIEVSSQISHGTTVAVSFPMAATEDSQTASGVGASH
ncbi:MAG: sensor histidine kinase [Gammaproteobacteria bacterium]|nr:sensor histidine kinase [Gammaproteobacteria bacterium]MCP4088337.1 sensor histidine kinase [Gammaproteobacteria bacterium]MCP4275451.1 sensor histidine kinase [Gammaproteobacteria bacterium]MCP4830999.1 sensor histidine kinase [Gammaproteobacteria bacterium]MCP4927480.1 sensor histidine kinase [Gammaproteobacteria bacterium]